MVIIDDVTRPKQAQIQTSTRNDPLDNGDSPGQFAG
jgi:hypothetical protein